MGKGGYNGGSTIFRIWSPGWVSFDRPDLTKTAPKGRSKQKRKRTKQAALAAKLAAAQQNRPQTPLFPHSYSDVVGLDQALDRVLAWVAERRTRGPAVKTARPAPPPEAMAAAQRLMAIKQPKAISASDMQALNMTTRTAPKFVNGPSKAERRAQAAADAAAEAAAAAKAAAEAEAAQAAKEAAIAARRRDMRLALWHKLKARREAQGEA